MLMPKRTKWRRPHREKLKGDTKGGAYVAFGEYGLQALECGYITARQIEATRIAITRKLRKGGKVWIRIFPDVAYTKKPLETRMGKGKGSPEFWVAPVKRGRIMFEVAGVSREIVERAFRTASYKLPIKVRLVAREGLGGE
ncbi:MULTISPECIES: 50S ribosomal protein L16 [Dethiosulfovibrio]|uniref:Large ribosomal subunit protein uL16 n=3 Tax=Dethiosulfovibrio TaxID=47054 RepID=D2Z920_9BACT|nr:MULTISPECIES: 50S ribosomal protein L16 [Dethiosulfovibrio]EFC91967.1 ribosomal protein L16 [Dethiosulfovibrio peptidovorans DSM 11002]MCF4113013.1 50S ribosomal protein L16 [Dethiosulfovibrio russensis]MCF4141477.1 50S ribosomal protein L16 [Dethiosulfovibrio marinus]MCF4144433.1 50S ribosomal protein L16 [Dethiosulfovibrio acidaminovorans]MCF4152465.1 50S ribosomal protein L16 [Dethiosulfovibrio faecalis]